MCLSTVSLAIFLLLGFKSITLHEKGYSSGASAYIAHLGSGKKFICLGDINVGVILSMTGDSCQKLRYDGIEQLSQV